MSNHVITDTTEISKNNKIKILNLVRNHRGITRPEIAKILGLSLPTVSRQVDNLIRSERLIHEVGKEEIFRGRPPKQLEFLGDDNYLIGINMGANKISGVLTNLNAQILAQDNISPDPHYNYEKMIKESAHLIRKLIKKSDVQVENVLGIGIAIGGLIERQHHILNYSATFNWRDKDITAALGQYIHKPIRFDHTARVMALGELYYGIGSTIKNFICILWGYGIGAASIIDGKLYYGARSMAGEFGHMTINTKNNIKCLCGNYGCLETCASGWAIERMVKEKRLENKRTLLHEQCQSAKISAKLVANAARQGDRVSVSILNKAAEYMGLGLANLINFHNPEAIILGGGIMNMSDLILDRVIEVARERSLRNISNSTIIQPVSLGNESKTMGAVSLILNEVLNLNISKKNIF